VIYSASDEKALMTELWDPQLAEDPEAFVMFVYPWGKEGTPLHNKKGPRAWQRDELQCVAEHIKMNKIRMAKGEFPIIYKSATASGRGPGKSAFMEMIRHWMMTCQLGSTTIVTANTEEQLKGKTWGEVGKWLTLAINGHWFEKQALSVKPAPWFREALKNQLKIDWTYYYAAALLWSEENPDAFAGAHNENGVLVEYDEASGIHEKIWSVTEGFFTEPVLHRYWFAMSNPRRNTGAFFDCFHDHKAFWKTRNIDSRTVEGIDKDHLNSIIEKYGENSYEAKVEVKGEFPDQSDKQFIARNVVQDAVARTLDEDLQAPLIMGVDPARYGADKAVIRFRQGRNGRVIPPMKFSGLDNMQLARKVIDAINKYNPDAVAVDAGSGTGVIDRVREEGYRVSEVWFGSHSDDPEWGNKRTELWDKMRDWLKGASIDNDDELIRGLVAPEFGPYGKTDKLILEPKESMRSKGLKSPDDADALALTFAVKPARRDLRTTRQNKVTQTANDVDYDVLNH
jgi:hypothetical protein